MRTNRALLVQALGLAAAAASMKSETPQRVVVIDADTAPTAPPDKPKQEPEDIHAQRQALVLEAMRDQVNPATVKRHVKHRLLPQRTLRDVAERLDAREAKLARRAKQARSAGLLP